MRKQSFNPTQLNKVRGETQRATVAYEAVTPVELMRPENGYEGYGLPIGPSLRGSSTKPENGLRDPAIFQESGKIYTLYSVEGEKGIGIAELVRH